MKWFRNLIGTLIYTYHWMWVAKTINFLALLEMQFKILVRKITKKPRMNNIPHGMYCYDNDHICPYFHISKVAEFFYGYQLSGYCALLEQGDFNSEDVPLLWDMCKMCQIYDDEEWSEELDELFAETFDAMDEREENNEWMRLDEI